LGNGNCGVVFFSLYVERLQTSNLHACVFFSFVCLFPWFFHGVQVFVEIFFFYKEINADCLAGEVWCRVNLDLKIFFF